MPDWADALEGVRLTERPGDRMRAYMMRRRPEDVEIDRSRAVVVVCDRCDAQPLVRAYCTPKGHLCVDCAEAIRKQSFAFTHC